MAFENEALKAQAVAARTYTLYKKNAYDVKTS
jgi:peptidoglycan hydrolase-like amidase